MGEFLDQFDVGHGLVENDAIDRLHVLVDEVHQRFQVLRAFARLVERTILSSAVVWVGAGSERHMAMVSPLELVRLTSALTVDLVQE